MDVVKKCKTSADSEKNANKDCLFPFIHEGVKYHECADLKAGFDTYPNVCATEYGDDGMTVRDIGTCSDECNNKGKYLLVFRVSRFVSVRGEA